MADPLHLYDVDADGNPVIIIPPTATTPSVVIPTSDSPPGVVIGQPSTGGGGGVTDHNLLSGRSTPDQHPIGAVTGLQGALDGKVSTSDQRLSDARTPTAHKTSHATGGTDPLTPADIDAADASHAHDAADITSGVIAAARLGTGTADATTVLHGDGTWGAGVSSGYRAQFLLGGM